MLSQSGLWMQNIVHKNTWVYDALLGEKSFMYGFPLISAGSCGFLQARRQLLAHTGIPNPTSYILDKKQGVLLHAEGKLLYFLFLPNERVACYQYMPSKIALFGRLGELFDSMLPYAAESNLLELHIMQHLKPGFTKIGSQFQSECQNISTITLLLPNIFFINLSRGTGITANLYLKHAQEPNLPSYLLKGIWSFQGDLHVHA